VVAVGKRQVGGMASSLIFGPLACLLWLASLVKSHIVVALLLLVVMRGRGEEVGGALVTGIFSM